MQRWATWSICACLLLAAPASAQTYRSALPLQGADAGDFEGRLANILEFARPNQVTRFRLPSGRTVSVRSYQPTQISGSGPCRGYRVDLSGDSGFMAVDGFRCRDLNGNRWRLVEPETVLAQSGNPPRALNQTALAGDRAGATRRRDGEPLYANDDLVGPDGIPVDASGNPIGLQSARRAGPPAPVPRRRPAPPQRVAALPDTLAPALSEPQSTPVLSAPQTTPVAPQARASLSAPVDTELPPQPTAGLTETADRTILLAEPQAGEPAYVTQLRERIERARRLEAEVASAVAQPTPPQALTAPTPDRTAAVITPSLTPDSGAGDTMTNSPASTVYQQPTPIAPALSNEVDVAVAARAAGAARPVANEPSRVVGERQTDEILGYAADRRIVTALQDLRYLSGGIRPSAAAVDSAVDEFATDERFALPVANDALLAKLSDALIRSTSLPSCGSDPSALCVAPQ